MKISAGGFTTTDSRYQIVDWEGLSLPGIIKKDSAITVKLEYSPTDSSFSRSFIEILGSACSGMDMIADGMIDLFCSDVDMGDCVIDDSVSAVISQLFCNNSASAVNITGLNIETGDASMFEYINFNPPLPCTLDSGQCLQVTFRFKPVSLGSKYSRISLTTSVGTFYSNITGNGLNKQGVNDYIEGQAKLEEIYPNPATGITNVNFTLSEPGVTKLWVINVLGGKIMKIGDNYMEPGAKELSFDSGRLTNGVFFVLMQTPTQLLTRKFNVIK